MGPHMKQWIAVTALALPLLVTPTSPADAAVTCQGQRATLVGGDRYGDIEGTDGPDVIVSAGAGEIDSRGGDDLICLTLGREQSPTDIGVDAGAGDDRVYGTSLGDDFVYVALGAGEDTYRGGVANEFIGGGSLFDSSELGGDGPDDSDPDHIDTRGGGFDYVAVGDGGVLEDDVAVGSGVVEVTAAGLGDGASLVGGPGSTLTVIDDNEGRWSLDLDARTATHADQRFVWSGFRRFTWAVPGDVALTGSSGRDVFSGPITSADAGPGDDVITVWSSASGGVPTGAVEGGAGHDIVRFVAAQVDEEIVPFTPDDVLVDVGRRRAVFAHGTTYDVTGFETYGARTDGRAVVRGGAGADRLIAGACRLDMRGGGGDDVLLQTGFESYGLGVTDCSGPNLPSRAVLAGGAGDDRIDGQADRNVLLGGPGDDHLLDYGHDGRVIARGGSGADLLLGGRRRDDLRGGPGRDVMRGDDGADVLVGGPGLDRGYGGRGRDRCRVERRTACE